MLNELQNENKMMKEKIEMLEEKLESPESAAGKNLKVV